MKIAKQAAVKYRLDSVWLTVVERNMQYIYIQRINNNTPKYDREEQHFRLLFHSEKSDIYAGLFRRVSREHVRSLCCNFHPRQRFSRVDKIKNI